MKKSTATALLAVFGSIGGTLLMCLMAALSLYMILWLRVVIGPLLIVVPLIFAASYPTALLRLKLNRKYGIKNSVFIICVTAAPLVLSAASFLLMEISRGDWEAVLYLIIALSLSGTSAVFLLANLAFLRLMKNEAASKPENKSPQDIKSRLVTENSDMEDNKQ